MMMKKIVPLLVAIELILCLCFCSDKSSRKSLRAQSLRENADISACDQASLKALSLDSDWLPPDNIETRIQAEHPRLLFNESQWAKIKARANGELAQHTTNLTKWLSEHESYPQDPPNNCPDDHYDKGVEAMQAAFLYKLTGEAGYAITAKNLLSKSLSFYKYCSDNRKSVNWYTRSRINAMTALDILYPNLEAAERISYCRDLIDHVKADISMGTSGPWSGYYTSNSMMWYAGLACHGSGADDAQTRDWLRAGVQEHSELLRYRKQGAGDDGSGGSNATAYALNAYPWAEFNFLHSWQASMGENLVSTGPWQHIIYFPNYVYWNWIPSSFENNDGGMEKGHVFGLGHETHRTNGLDYYLLGLHLSQAAYFAKPLDKDMYDLALHLRKKFGFSYSVVFWGLNPYLLDGVEENLSPALPEAPPLMRHLEGLGQFSFRSGNEPGDTFGVFIAGAKTSAHKDHDENSFVLYREGFLAIDSGTRRGEDDSKEHMAEYMSRSIAHNTVSIDNPEERFGDFDPYFYHAYWQKPNGSQRGEGNLRKNADVRSFFSNDLVAYAAADAGPAYNTAKQKKADEFMRQILFIKPNLFLVFDRVTATDARYKRTWHLHTASDPHKYAEGFYSADAAFAGDATWKTKGGQAEGKLFWKTFLPIDPVEEIIGGEGKEFWSVDQNFNFSRYQNEMTDLMGRFRYDIIGAEQKTDYFLVALKTEGAEASGMGEFSLVEDTPEQVKVKIQANNLVYDVIFKKEKADELAIINISSQQTSVFSKSVKDGEIQTQIGMGNGNSSPIVIPSQSGDSGNPPTPGTSPGSTPGSGQCIP